MNHVLTLSEHNMSTEIRVLQLAKQKFVKYDD